MGYGIGRSGVDVAIVLDGTLRDFAQEVGSMVAKLLVAGCRRMKLEVHERGAVLSSDTPVAPADVPEEVWEKDVREVVCRG